MTRSLTAMRVWLTMEAQDLAIVQYKNRRPRAEARGIVIARIGLEMAQDGYDIKSYKCDVDEIVDSALDELYGEIRNEDYDEGNINEVHVVEVHAPKHPQ